MGEDHDGHAGMDLCYGGRLSCPCWEGPLLWRQTTVAILRWTSTLGADHYGHAGIDPHNGLGQTPKSMLDPHGELRPQWP